MNKPRKEDLIAAFQGRQRKRNRLLYEYYRDTYFSGDYSAVYVAKCISAELGIEMSPNMVYKIHGLIKKEREKPRNLSCPSFRDKPASTSLEEEGENNSASRGKTPKGYVIKNGDEYPKEDPYRGQLDDL